jgi:hypothetical protein
VRGAIAGIAESLHVAETAVSTHLHLGKHMRYELSKDRWYLRSARG